MRVLITPEWFPWPDRPYYGAFCREQALAASRLMDVAVMTWRLDSGLRMPFRLHVEHESGLETVRVRFARGRVDKVTAAFKLAGCLAAVAHLRARGWAPDVVHAHQYSAAPVAYGVSALSRAPVIFTEHYSGFSTLPERERRRAKWAFERASLVCPVSCELARHVVAVAPRAKVEPVPNVVDTDVFAPGAVRPPNSPPRLVTVGALIERKGHRHLFEALARMREAGQDLPLEVIGDGPLRSALEALTGNLGVADLVSFQGAKNKTAVAAALRGADVFVLPSLSENLPCALLEALSTGLPVVATDVGGVREAVDADQGVVVAAGSSDALADGLRQIVSGVADYDSHRLRARAVADFGYAAVSRRWANVYSTVAQQHGRTRR